MFRCPKCNRETKNVQGYVLSGKVYITCRECNRSSIIKAVPPEKAVNVADVAPVSEPVPPEETEHSEDVGTPRVEEDNSVEERTEAVKTKRGRKPKVAE